MKNRTKYYNALYSVDAKLLACDRDIRNDVSPLNDAEISVLFPQDPTSCQIADLLSQVLKTENPLLRDSLLSKLQTLPSNSSALNAVDDVTKIQLLKPRSCQSLSEMSDFTKYVESAIEQLNIDPNQVETPPSSDAQSEDPVSVSE